MTIQETEVSIDEGESAQFILTLEIPDQDNPGQKVPIDASNTTNRTFSLYTQGTEAGNTPTIINGRDNVDFALVADLTDDGTQFVVTLEPDDNVVIDTTTYTAYKKEPHIMEVRFEYTQQVNTSTTKDMTGIVLAQIFVQRDAEPT